MRVGKLLQGRGLTVGRLHQGKEPTVDVGTGPRELLVDRERGLTKVRSGWETGPMEEETSRRELIEEKMGSRIGLSEERTG